MERMVMKDLIAWKSSYKRRPLILNGARQVGKTWLIREFAQRQFKNLAYVNMENNETMRSLFDRGYDIPRIISGIEIETGISIDPDTTLIAFDEIQEIPKALTALKYFYENAPHYHVIAAGSLLGIEMHQGSSFPVGKVDTLNVYPLTFEEFILTQYGHALFNALRSNDIALIEAFREKLIAALKDYYYVGGMPDVINTFGDELNYNAARLAQLRILSDYERDFAKHVKGKDVQHLYAVWESIPNHLAQENKRFVFGHIAKGSRAKDYETAITWLMHAGLLYKVPRVSKPGMPLQAYKDTLAFKAYILDVGLLGAMCQMDVRSIISGNTYFTEFKGALTEQYVCQQLIASLGVKPFYWSAENSQGEVDFLIQNEGAIYAIEVKAEENLKAKSLRALQQKYPEIQARRFSLSPFRQESWMLNIPLYAIDNAHLWLGTNWGRD